MRKNTASSLLHIPFFIFLACSHGKYKKPPCASKLESISEKYFKSVPEDKINEYDYNTLRLARLDYGPKFFSDIRNLHERDLSCSERVFDEFYMSKAVIFQLNNFKPVEQKEIMRDFIDHLYKSLFRKKNSLLQIQVSYSLLNKASDKGKLSHFKNKIKNERISLEEKAHKIQMKYKGDKDNPHFGDEIYSVYLEGKKNIFDLLSKIREEQ